jgi:hypothetical protein
LWGKKKGAFLVKITINVCKLVGEEDAGQAAPYTNLQADLRALHVFQRFETYMSTYYTGVKLNAW